jgi:hypothetical protein
MFNAFRGISIVLMIATALACAKSPKPAPAGQMSKAEMDKLVQVKSAEDPVLRTQTDIGLDALLVGEGMVQVTLVNKTRQPLVVGPKLFVVSGPDRKPVPAEPQSLKTFPLTRVPAGEQASGQLIFPPRLAVRGARLAFDPHRPDCRAALTVIR